MTVAGLEELVTDLEFNWGHFYGGQISCEIVFILLMLVGYAFAKLEVITYEGLVSMSKLAMEVFLPVYVFIYVCRSTSRDLLKINAEVIISQLVLIAFCVCIAYTFSKFTKMDIRYRWTFVSIASISEIKYMNHLNVGTFCYHLKVQNSEETTYCNNLENYNYSHMFFQYLISWYILYYGIREDRKNWRKIIEVGRETAKAHEEKIEKLEKLSIEIDKIDQDETGEIKNNDLNEEKEMNLKTKTKDKRAKDSYDMFYVKENQAKSFNYEHHNVFETDNMKTNENFIVRNKSKEFDLKKTRLSKRNSSQALPMIKRKSLDYDNTKTVKKIEDFFNELRKEKQKIKKKKMEDIADAKNKMSKEIKNLFNSNMKNKMEISTLYVDDDFFQEIESFHSQFIEVKKKGIVHQLLYYFLGPIQIAMFTGFIVGFITPVKNWIFDKKGGQFMFYDSFFSIGNAHLFVMFATVGGCIFIKKEGEYVFRFRIIDHIALLILRSLILPYLGLLYTFIIHKINSDNKVVIWNSYLQWITPTSIDIITMIQAKELPCMDAAINLFLQWIIMCFVSTFTSVSAFLRIINL